jgi:hypothetical protein
MELIKQLQNEVKQKIKQLDNTKNNKEFEDLEIKIFNLVDKLRIEYKNKYKLNMIYSYI